MDILNNREIATGVWLLTFFIWASTKKEVRESFRTVVAAFLSRFIIVPIILMVSYITLLLIGLESIGLWENHQVKNVVFWFFTAAMYSFFKVTKAAEDKHYFSHAVRDNLKIIVVLQFVISVYTFSLWVELIFVPVISMLVVVMTYAQSDEKYKPAEKLVSKLVEGIGLFIIAYTVYMIFADFGELAQTKSIYDLLVPTTLSIMLLPFLYLLATYTSYQGVFVRLKFWIKEPSLLRYTKWSTIKRFHFRFAKLVRWFDSVPRINIESKADVDKSIENVFRQLREESNPPTVDKRLGWSPHIAKDYLAGVGIETGFYKNIYDDTWHVSSKYLEMGNSIMPNNIAYYVEGNREVAKSIKLKLNVNEPSESADAKEKFLNIANLLCWQAINSELPDSLRDAISEEKNSEIATENRKLSIVKSAWGNTERYDLMFKLEVTDENDELMAGT